MPLVVLTTRISAPVERVFDLARSIDANMASTSQSGEKAVGGRTRGLIEEGETVTWEATHFGIKQRLTVKVTRVDRPFVFEDEMVSGSFSFMTHQHRFEEKNGVTEMTDRFEYRAPLGIIGRLAEGVFLTIKQQLTRLSELERRELSAFIVRLGQESKEWKEETALRLDEMGAGKRTSLSDLKDQTDHD